MSYGPQKPTARKNRAAGNQEPTSRAEDIRSRRAQRSQEQINKVTARVALPPPVRPVTVRNTGRGSLSGRETRQPVGTRARRQFYLTMDRAAGTEVRLPAIPMIRPGWRLASAFLALVMVIGIYSMWNSPFLQVEMVEVKGIQRLNPDEIAAKLNLEILMIIEVNPVQAEAELASAYPELINVRVSVGMPNAVTVSAEERQPVLAVQQGDQVNWVDASGVLFPARGDAGPLVTILAEDGLPLAPAPPVESQPAAEEAASNEEDRSASEIVKKTVPVTGPVMVDPTVLAALEGLGKLLPPETQLVYSMQDGLGWQ
ncbi:MAG: FtsQ-type POTRA domain-containing protein, partial [Chloroflexi bacterium]